jgi:hypothetical protein
VSPGQRTRRDYLVLADISGYTALLAGIELEHATAIVYELTTLIRERLVELIESCYLDFSDCLLDMDRGTTCRCAACASSGSLDLKFVAHHGTYVADADGDREDLAGPDVILAHRLPNPAPPTNHTPTPPTHPTNHDHHPHTTTTPSHSPPPPTTPTRCR